MSAPAAARQSLIFVGLVYLIVTGIALVLPHADVATPLLAMVTPLVVLGVITAFATPRGRRRELWKGFGLRRLDLRSWPVAVGVAFVAVLAVPWTVAAVLGSATLALAPTDVPAWLVNVAIGIAMTTLLALGEEIGWRGYLLPRVQTLLPRRQAALLVGLVHGLFHLPLVLLTTTYNSVGNRAVVATSMVLTITAAGVFYAWLKDRAGSVWPVAVAHGAINTFLDGAGVFVVASPLVAYTAGETGLATLLTVLVGAVVLLRRRRAWATAPIDPKAPTPSSPTTSDVTTDGAVR